MDTVIDNATPRFLGEHTHQVDGKNRLTLPSSMREKIPDDLGLILSTGLDRCLTLFPEHRFDEYISEYLQKGPSSEARQLRRQFSAQASEVELDSQGRFVLPGRLKEWAEIEDSVEVIGNFDRVELWSPERWRQYREAGNLEEAAQSLYEGGS